MTELYEAADCKEYTEVMMYCKDFMHANSVRPGLTMACNTCSQRQDVLRLRNQDAQQRNRSTLISSLLQATSRRAVACENDTQKPGAMSRCQNEDVSM